MNKTYITIALGATAFVGAGVVAAAFYDEYRGGQKIRRCHDASRRHYRLIKEEGLKTVASLKKATDALNGPELEAVVAKVQETLRDVATGKIVLVRADAPPAPRFEHEEDEAIWEPDVSPFLDDTPDLEAERLDFSNNWNREDLSFRFEHEEEEAISKPNVLPFLEDASDLETERLDLLNNWSREELLTLEGIGATIADRIIANRPFTSLEAVQALPRMPIYLSQL